PSSNEPEQARSALKGTATSMDELRGRHCLVTGGAGYVAASVVRELCGVAARVRRFGRSLNRPALASTSTIIEDVVGDVTQRADVERGLVGRDVVSHLPSQTRVYIADADPAADLLANVAPLAHLLEASRTSGRAITLLFAGTATEFGLATKLPVD